MSDTAFHGITREEFLKLDPKTKDAAARARHLGIIRNSEKQMQGLLLEAMLNSRTLPDGTERPPYRHDELVVVLMHRDDMITPPELRAAWSLQNIEIGILLSERTEFAQALCVFTARQCADKGCRQWFADGDAACAHCNTPAAANARVVRPYEHAGRTIMKAAPPMTFYTAVFDLNVCTITYLGFDPHNPGVDEVPADPNYPAPPPAIPLPPSEPSTKKLEG